MSVLTMLAEAAHRRRLDPNIHSTPGLETYVYFEATPTSYQTLCYPQLTIVREEEVHPILITLASWSRWKVE